MIGVAKCTESVQIVVLWPCSVLPIYNGDPPVLSHPNGNIARIMFHLVSTAGFGLTALEPRAVEPR